MLGSDLHSVTLKNRVIICAIELRARSLSARNQPPRLSSRHFLVIIAVVVVVRLLLLL
jgi:hypothetical protein